MFVAFLAVSGFVQAPTSAGYGFTASVLGASAAYLLPGALAGVLIAPLGGRLVHRSGPARCSSSPPCSAPAASS